MEACERCEGLFEDVSGDDDDGEDEEVNSGHEDATV